MLQSRKPRIKLKLTFTDKVIEGLAIVALIVVWILTVLYYPNLPEVIPTHFDAAGNVNGYGNKNTLLILPALSTVLYAVFTVLNKFPHVMNYPVEITEQNAEKQYYNATRFMRLLKFIIIMVFALIVQKTQETISGNSNGLDKWLLPVILGSVLIPTVFYLVKAFQIKE